MYHFARARRRGPRSLLRFRADDFLILLLCLLLSDFPGCSSPLLRCHVPNEISLL